MNSRHRAIIEFLKTGNDVTVKEMAYELSVTEMTIRRDLKELVSAGKCVRTHGGARLSVNSVVEFTFQKKSMENTEGQKAVAQCMARMVKPGSTLVIDTGSTTLHVAQALAQHKGLRVLTSSLAIASLLFAHEGIELILLGGTVRKTSPDLTGPLTEDALSRFTVDVAILGADAITPDGLYTTDIGVSRISQAMLKSARKTYVVADSSKFCCQSFIQFADWKAIHALVTDENLPPECRTWLTKIGVELHIAPINS